MPHTSYPYNVRNCGRKIIMNKAVFLDRDGTINVEKHYLYKIEDFEFLPGVIEGLKMLQDAGYILVIITNQSGIARGYYTEDDFYKLNDWMLNELEKEGIEISGVYYCPHLPDARIERYRKTCDCRKPALGMFKKAKDELNIDIDSSFAIGDKIRDLSICETTGCKGILINNNEDKRIIDGVERGKSRHIIYADNLKKAAKRIVEETK